jgi:hypothetical protein
MSNIALNQNTRLTDALERDLLRGAMERHQTVRPTAMITRTYLAIANAVRNFSDYIAEVRDVMQRARAASSHYTGSQW